jgi:hypothetical protein
LQTKKQALDPGNFRRCAFLVASNSGSKWTIPEARQFPLYRRKPTCYIVPTIQLFMAHNLESKWSILKEQVSPNDPRAHLYTTMPEV